MSPVVNPRSTVPPKHLRVRWGLVGLTGFVMLCSASAYPNEFFPLSYALFISWLLWRGGRDSGRH